MFVYDIEGTTYGTKEPGKSWKTYERAFKEKVLASNLTEAISILEKKELAHGFWEDHGGSHSNDVEVAKADHVVVKTADLVTKVTLQESKEREVVACLCYMDGPDSRLSVCKPDAIGAFKVYK